MGNRESNGDLVARVDLVVEKLDADVLNGNPALLAVAIRELFGTDDVGIKDATAIAKAVQERSK